MQRLAYINDPISNIEDFFMRKLTRMNNNIFDRVVNFGSRQHTDAHEPIFRPSQ